MLKLKFNLRHQDIQLVNKGVVVATDSKDYLVAKFNTISDDWETPLTAIFTDDKHKQPYAVIVGADERLAENECFVPWEVLTDAVNVYVSVYCGNLHTTVTSAFRVRKSGYIEGETPPPPSPTVYDIIMQAITDLQVGKQDKLIAGENITINANGEISAAGGVTSYTELSDKPQINGHELVGNKSSDDLGLQNKLTAGENITINANGEISASGGVTSYAELNNKPKVLNSNGILISQILDSLQFGSDFTVSNVEDPNKININLTRYISGSKITEKSLPLNSIVADGFARLFKYIPEYGVTCKDINDYGKYSSGDGYSQGQGCFITKITDFSYYRNMPVNSPCFLINATPYGDKYGFQAIVAYDVVNNSTVIKTRFSYNLSNSSWTSWQEIGGGYTLTEQDKQDIADIVLGELPNADTMSF